MNQEKLIGIDFVTNIKVHFVSLANEWIVFSTDIIVPSVGEIRQ